MPVLGAENPLPIAARALARLPLTEPIPLSLRDVAGARHPAQLARDEDGPALLVELELGALAATILEPLDQPAAGAWWEVSPRVLDNGRVRAELDAQGRLARLSWDGAFADWSGPAVAPLVDGAPLAGEARVAVIESGPVRAVVAVELRGLELRYALHAHEDLLRISARWRGAVPLELAHPTPAGVVTAAERWLALADGLGRGVALVSRRPLDARVADGCALVAVRERVDYALLAAQRPAHALGLGQVAQTLGLGHLAHHGEPRPAPFRLVAPQHVVALDPRAGDGWRELLLVEEAGAKAKVFLYPMAAAGATGAKVDHDGRAIAPVRATPEGDGLLIELAPRETARVRWRI